MRIDLEEKRPALGNVTGGLSGHALLPINLANVWRVREVVDIPVVGSGGIVTDADALATGLFVMGPERGIALVERTPGVEALFFGADLRVQVSGGFPPYEIVD